jgi:DNA polymerase-3 subunit beta
MRFSTEAKALKKALRTVRGAISKRSTMPILGSVRIEASAEGISISATDLEVSLTLALPFDVLGVSGVAIVPLKALEATLKTIKGLVTLETDGETLKVGDENYSASLQGNIPDEYPTLPPSPEGNTPTQALGALREALGIVAYAASSGETRYNLNGIAVDADSGHCIATDGHRLCIAEAGSVSFPWEGIRILPLKGVKLLAKLLKGSGDCARIAFDGKAAAFQGEGFSLSIRVIEGEYLNYNQVIPKKVGETIRVDRDALLGSIERVAVAAPERSRAVKVTFNSGIGLEASNPDTGSASAHVDATRGRGESDTTKTIALNANYLRDAVAALDPGEIRIGIASGKIQKGYKLPDYSCCPIKVQGSEEYPLCVVMPTRV